MGADAEPRCAIEASICALRQLVVRPQQGGNGQGKDDPSSCEFAGAEWWVQRRPVSRSLDMHFDADSCLMHRNGRLRCPEVSSILYLTSSGGPTVILDQFVANGILWGHRLLPGEATRVDLVFPTPNQFAAFPGLFLHGVMPDLGGATTSAKDGAQDVRTTLLVNWWWGNKPEGPCCSPLSDEMAALLRCSSETSSGGDGPAVEDQPLECDLQKWRNGVTSVEGDVSVMGRTMNYDYFIPDDCKEYPWVERRNVTVTELGHIRRIRTAFGA